MTTRIVARHGIVVNLLWVTDMRHAVESNCLQPYTKDKK